MNTKKLSVNRALIELKTVEDRITNAIGRAVFVVANKDTNKVIGGKTLDEVKTQTKANLDSVQGLIAYRDALKKAIVMSNASTNVEVANKVMTVAEAIEKKSSIEYQKVLLQEMATQLSRAKREVENQKAKAENGLETFLKASLGDEGAKDAALVESLTKQYFAQREYSLVSGFDVEKLYNEMSDELSAFEADVDGALTDCNSLTVIEVQVS